MCSQITRTWWAGIPNTWAQDALHHERVLRRRPDGEPARCVELSTGRRWVPGSRAPAGRCVYTSSTTRLASAYVLAATSPCRMWMGGMIRLSSVSWRLGAPGCMASWASNTAGSSSYTHFDQIQRLGGDLLADCRHRRHAVSHVAHLHIQDVLVGHQRAGGCAGQAHRRAARGGRRLPSVRLGRPAAPAPGWHRPPTHAHACAGCA